VKFLKKLLEIVPIFFTALILALVVWVSSVTSQDPDDTVTYGTPIQLTIMGLNPELVITEQSSGSVMITVKAPRSVHDQLSRSLNRVTARINLNGLNAGTYDLTPEINIGLRPTKLVEVSPAEISLTLEQVATRTADILLIQNGTLPIGYEAGDPVLSAKQAQIFGPQSRLDEVFDLIATIDLSNTTTSISRSLELKPVDKRGNVVQGVSVNPKSINLEIPIKQLVGYRNVFVKIITTGSIAPGYHLTGLVVTPPNLTIYASNAELVKNLPAFLDTAPVNLNGAKESFSVKVPLQVQDGITIIGEQEVTVDVGIEAIQSSIQLFDIPVQIVNLGSGLKASISPEKVDVYISGPLHLLESLKIESVEVLLDLANRAPGTYQIAPTINLLNSELRLDSVLPGTIEVTISK
jgi:YbbR domain-containing protein